MEPPGPSVLYEPTLVLNRSWVPINTTTARHALTLLAKESAFAIQVETFDVHNFDSWRGLMPLNGDRGIRSVRTTIRLPEVIVLTSYDHVPHKRVPFTRRNLYRRDDFRCQYCGTRKPAERLSIDHVVPRSRGGSNSWENCVLACVRCNVKKGCRFLRDSGMKLLRRPQRPEWSPCLGIKRVKRKASWEKFVSQRTWHQGFET